MNNHQKSYVYSGSRTSGLVKAGIVASLYIVFTMLVAPVAFGPIQFRISEALNFLGLYNRRYIFAVTAGVFLVNYIQFGVIDMVVGSGATFVFLWLGRWTGEWLVKQLEKTGKIKFDSMLIKYFVMTIAFMIQMLPIAAMLLFIGAEAAFWPTFVSLAISEGVAMTLGAFVMYPISKRIDFNE